MSASNEDNKYFWQGFRDGFVTGVVMAFSFAIFVAYLILRIEGCFR